MARRNFLELGQRLGTIGDAGSTLGRTSRLVSPVAGASGTRSFIDIGRRFGTYEEEEEELTGIARFVSDLPDPVRENVGGALRGLASALAPLQLPQDVLFATIAGALDDDSTITQRLSRIEWGKYFPGGEIPARPAQGEEIFDFLGFDRETAKWAGIMADITVDPLIFGSWLRVGGKLSGVQDLVRLGNRVDHFVSPIGMGREVAKVARRSRYLSDFMDARTEAVINLIRNPDSQLFGIHRFGEKATRVMEQFLPRGPMLEMRFGREMGRELRHITQMAEETGRRVSQDALLSLQRAQQGPLGDQAIDLVRGFARTAEEQARAHRNHLDGLPTILRDVIEKEVYDTAQRYGFLAFMRGERGASRVLDPQTRALGEEVLGAVTRETARRPGVRDVEGTVQDFLEQAHRIGESRLIEAREAVRKVAGDQARRSRMPEQAIMEAERGAVDIFNRYLRDTVQIDARLGMQMSGYEFIGNNLMTRGFELTGSRKFGEQLWDRLLTSGLRGRQHFDAMMDESTGLSLRNLVRHLSPDDLKRGVETRMRYRGVVESEMRRLGVTRNLLRDDTYQRRVGELVSEAEDIRRALYKMERIPGSTPELQKLRSELLDAADAWHNASRNMDPRVNRILQELPGDAPSQLVPRLTSERLQAEQRLDAAMSAYQDAVRSIRGAPADTLRPRVTAAGKHPVSRRVAMDRLSEIQDTVETLGKRFRTSQYRRAISMEEAQHARALARAEAGPTPRVERVAEAVDDIPNIQGVPMAGRNTVAEDMIADRMARGMSLSDALAEPVTFREILGGTASMQALNLGDFLEGIMSGHLRRAYAIFQDPNDFKRYVDALRIGRIVPSQFVDENALKPALAARGFEREADLILGYQQALTRNGRGHVLRHDHIVDHMLQSGIAPERARGAMRAMIEHVHQDNKHMSRLLRHLDEMVPRYRQEMRRREQAGRFVAEQPRITGERYFDPREIMPEEMLTTLGEYAQASMSIIESSEIARRVVSKQDILQQVLVLGRKRGYIKDAPHTDQFGTRFMKLADGDTVMPGYAGKYIHPYLAQELQRATSTAARDVHPALTRVRSLITGGMLATPNVIAANTFGGFYQAAQMGMNPAVMIRNMIEVFPEMMKFSRGQHSDLVADLARHMPLETTTLSYDTFYKHLRRIRLDDFGMGPEGMQRAFENFTNAYERFLQAPGLGKMRLRLAGLEGFQFTENWFKLAAFNEQKRRLTRQLLDTDRYRMAQRTMLSGDDLKLVEMDAAELARLVVFDYSELPRSLERLKNYGLVLFPGFTYFLAGRTINTALQRPGVLATADRLSEAMANATLDLEDQMALLLGTPDWMKEEQGTPMPFTVREDEAGNKQVSVIPLVQLIPTQSIWDSPFGAGNPFAESIAQAGVIGPFLEIFRALVTNDGEAIMSGRYGARVFDPESEGLEKAAGVMRFMYNSFAPSILTKQITADYQGQLGGLFPAIPEMLRDFGVPIPEPLADTIYSFDERRTGRPDRSWRENVLSSFLRAPQVVALDGPLAGIRRELTNARTDLNRKLSSLRTKFNRARVQGNFDAAERYRAEMMALEAEFSEEWSMYVNFWRQYNERQQRP